MRFLILLFVVLSVASCRVDRAFLPGQEGMESVYEAKQVRGGMGVTAGNGILAHANINYSPLSNVGLFYDTRLAPNSQVHSIAAGYYKATYKNETTENFSGEKINVTTGMHWDFYGGASYLNTKNSLIFTESNFNPMTGIVSQPFYELSWQGMRYFAQGGIHIKAMHVGIDAILRQSWVEARNVSVFGLDPRIGINPEGDLKSRNPRTYTEIGFKMNFGSFNTPFYCGFVTRLGADTKFTKSAYAHSIVFLGANLDVAKFFTKKR